MTTANSTTKADAPPYSAEQIANGSFPERARMSSQNWANKSPNRPSVMALYWVKYFFVLIAIWAFWCSFNVGYTGFFSFSDWTFTTEAFKKEFDKRFPKEVGQTELIPNLTSLS